MKLKSLCLAYNIFIIFLATFCSYAGEFKAGKGEFILDGKPFIVRAAELHYPRIPKEYWEHRIKLSKALGMNTICLYTFWNVHEPVEGQFDFEGQNDLAAFIELCQANDMKVILRPGPYVCAEWEMGGLPWWLLKNPDVKLREDDDYFLEKVAAFEEEVASRVSNLTIDKGGPIIMVQVENEYGAYGEDKVYISKIRDILRKAYGEDIMMFQCDWSSNFTLNGLDDLLWTLNFGTGADIEAQFQELRTLRPESPLMCSEFWSGWFDKWGAAHETRPADEMIRGIDEMLSKGISFSLYMTHGGTNWGHWAGANSPGYSPDVTSYDYDAPITENGQPTEKYYLLRQTLEKYISETESLPDVPENIETMPIKRFSLSEMAPLFHNLPQPVFSEGIRPMEYFDQGFGSIIYSTLLPVVQEGSRLRIIEPHDFAQVFINGEPAGTLDRRNGEIELVLKGYNYPVELRILVEATGRINFGRAIKDYKGITDKVTLIPQGQVEGIELKGWNVYLLPDDLSFYELMDFSSVNSENKTGERYPRGVYRGLFETDNTADTFLNLENWGKGLVYVNGKCLGRFWEIGPQQTLYMPGAWLRKGKNEILIFDILGPKSLEIEGLEHPVIDCLKTTSVISAGNAGFDGWERIPLFNGSFADGPGVKRLDLEKPVSAEIISFEIIATHSPAEVPSIAELYFLDAEGNKLSREGWKVYSECGSDKNGNHTPDKIIDLQESTYWSPEKGWEGPLKIIFDFGEEKDVSGILYVPRTEPGAPGAVKDFRLEVLQIGEK